MKYMLTLALIAVSGLAGSGSAEQTVVVPTEAELKVQELALLPVGLQVTHTPELVTENKQSPTGLEWIHSTTVTSEAGPVRIVEFGCLYSDGRTWHMGTVNRAPYDTANFAQWYDCPDARLEAGRTYTDTQNATRSSRLPGQKAKWYYIGVDANGNRLKGEADVNLAFDPSMDGC